MMFTNRKSLFLCLIYIFQTSETGHDRTVTNNIKCFTEGGQIEILNGPLQNTARYPQYTALIQSRSFTYPYSHSSIEL